MTTASEEPQGICQHAGVVVAGLIARHQAQQFVIERDPDKPDTARLYIVGGERFDPDHLAAGRSTTWM